MPDSVLAEYHAEYDSFCDTFMSRTPRHEGRMRDQWIQQYSNEAAEAHAAAEEAHAAAAGLLLSVCPTDLGLRSAKLVKVALPLSLHCVPASLSGTAKQLQAHGAGAVCTRECVARANTTPSCVLPDVFG